MLRTALFSLLALGVCSTSAFAQELCGDELKRLIEMPLKNIYVEYPNKTGHTFVDSTDLRLSPRDLHPAFYGCFDWHSAVHSHWMLCEVLRTNPQLAEREAILEAFDKHFTESNMLAEATYFDRKLAGSYERTYGWAWLLKLSEELHRLASEENDAELQGKAKAWSRHVDLLADKIVQKWKQYLPQPLPLPSLSTMHARGEIRTLSRHSFRKLVSYTPLTDTCQLSGSLTQQTSSLPRSWSQTL